MAREFLWTKPEAWTNRDKSEARWYHGAMIGGMKRASMVAGDIMHSPTATYEQKRIASEIEKLANELQTLLRTERVNC